MKANSNLNVGSSMQVSVDSARLKVKKYRLFLSSL